MKRPVKFGDVLNELALTSSWHGIQHVASSRQIPVKILWACLLMATSVILAIQMITLFAEYYSYPIKTSVSLKYHPITFPAITFCNMNPVKRSYLDDYEQLQDAISPKYQVPTNKKRKKRSTETGDSNSTNTETSTKSGNSVSDSTTNSGNSASDSTTDSGNTLTISPTPVSTTSGNNKKESSGTDSSGSDGTGNSTYYDDYWGNWYWRATSSSTYNYTNYKNVTDYSGASSNAATSSGYLNYIIDQFYSPKDEWYERTQRFQTEFRNETMETREAIGHMKEDMVLTAVYSGAIQNISLLQSMTSMEYGNCYTMSSTKYKAWKSGPATGIKLTFNLEIDEYIRNFASGYGIRMVFHEQGTFPLPSEEGITLSPGFDTSIGLRMVHVSRLGAPYGECTDGIAFQQRFKLKYTITACMQFCRVENIISTCGCFPSDGPDIEFTNELPRICNTSMNDRLCMLAVDANFDTGNTDCNCLSPCTDTVYEKTMSGRIWPNDDYLQNVLMADVCRANISSMELACEMLQNNTFDPTWYRNNFLQVQIYFEDLNYENIEQEPMYEFARFLSDIGGAMGLFMGGSLLSFVEILQLILEIGLYLRNRQIGDIGDNRVGDTAEQKVGHSRVSVASRNDPATDVSTDNKKQTELSMIQY